ncbi:MAG: AAA family ATPase [Magnetococcales bacterium]|nr:AAA family ATPase [Magnetococcales bacterium]NGZ28106.1 AAA family ATPase [Magnetococcales bacterium]
MKLKQVTVENFRCFEKLDIPLHPDINVFVGVNGSGKTAILDAIARSLGPLTHTCLYPSENFHYSEKFSVNDFMVDGTYNKLPRLESEIKSEAAFLINLCNDDDLNVDNSLNNYIYNWKMLGKVNIFKEVSGEYEVDFLVRYPEKIKKMVDADKIIDVSYPVFAYYRANRLFINMPDLLADVFSYRIERSQAYKDALDAGVDYKPMCQWFYALENHELRKGKEKGQIDLEYPELRSVRQAAIMAFEDVQKVIYWGVIPALHAVIKQADGTTKLLSIEQLSDGYRNMLALVMDFAHRMILANPHLEKPLEAPGILIIDELDLHMHPTWQQKVISNLRKIFPNTQLIVATHSPLILTTVKPECIRILKDYKLYSPPISTYGADCGRTLNLIMETESRPPNNEIVDEIRILYELINQKQYEIAKVNLQELSKKIGQDDPALIHADVVINNRLLEKEIGL